MVGSPAMRATDLRLRIGLVTIDVDDGKEGNSLRDVVNNVRLVQSVAQNQVLLEEFLVRKFACQESASPTAFRNWRCNLPDSIGLRY